MIHWQLTSRQFEAAFFAMMERDRLPYPIWNALHPGSMDDLDRQRREAIDTLMPRVDNDLARLIHTLAAPQVRVHMHGRVGGSADSPAIELRGYAGIGNSVAAVAIQEPDPHPGHSGNVTVSLCSRRQAELLLANILPAAQPGRHRLEVAKADFDLEPDWNGAWNRPPTPGEQVERFFSRYRSGWGEILCYPGPFLDNRTEGVQGFLWMDFARDGRYYVREDNYGYIATPITSDQFADHIENVIRRVADIASRR